MVDMLKDICGAWSVRGCPNLCSKISTHCIGVKVFMFRLVLHIIKIYKDKQFIFIFI